MKNINIKKYGLQFFIALSLLFACKNQPESGKFKVIDKKNHKIYIANKNDSLPEKVIYFDDIDRKGVPFIDRQIKEYEAIYDYIKIGDSLTLDNTYYNHIRQDVNIPAYKITNTVNSFHPVIYYVNDTIFWEYMNNRKNDVLREQMLKEMLKDWQKQ
ncbi:MAG: hypothetical protein LBJ18_01270 [Rickettsiales bacterium]|jgi:hypothetical protein|nr:hypothetical protein [Rickettsiales bacterium]